ncbi:hypothetical protein ACFVH6_21980 [Spirillospora sp. NPDC127200]
MSDPIICPECEGKCYQPIGTLRLRCGFCQGRGFVGGDHEPAETGPRYNAQGWKIPEEGEEYDPEIHGPLPGVRDHAIVRDTGVCGTCLDVRFVVDEQYRQHPCPDCGEH